MQNPETENMSLKNALIIGLAVVFSMIGIGLAGPVSFTTADDAKTLPAFLEENSVQRVLGASTEHGNSNGCPEDKPIVGWIDFRGRKTIRQQLPTGESPSACFETTEEANLQGFKMQE